MHKKYTNFISKNLAGGYAILFAVVVVSIISLLAIGMSNSAYKELVLSSLANDSQQSYYQSDTATECALYADNIASFSLLPSLPATWKCGKDQNGTDMSFTIGGGSNNYSTTSGLNNQSIPCFDFQVTKTGVSPITTNIYARGYNSCNKASPKTVEREIQVCYGSNNCL